VALALVEQVTLELLVPALEQLAQPPLQPEVPQRVSRKLGPIQPQTI